MENAGKSKQRDPSLPTNLGYMNRKNIPRQNPLPCAFLITKEGKGELAELLFLVIFFLFKLGLLSLSRVIFYDKQFIYFQTNAFPIYYLID